MKLTAQAILARWRVAALGLAVLAWAAVEGYQLTHNKGYQPNQPIAFSHALHAGQLGMDCLYCHTNATHSRHSSVPSVDSCMGCHTLVRTDSPEIQKLTEYYENNEPVPWVRIHSLPDHAYFNHAAHINAGVACQECHGPVETMEIVWQYSDLSMGWCMECHRGDEYLRTPERLAIAELTNQFAHSYYHLGEPRRVTSRELEGFASVRSSFWSGDDLNRFTEEEKLSAEEVHALIVEGLGYDSLSRQQGTRGRRGTVAQHIAAFQNASINCNICHY